MTKNATILCFNILSVPKHSATIYLVRDISFHHYETEREKKRTEHQQADYSYMKTDVQN
jgi:hypothetical protein